MRCALFFSQSHRDFRLAEIEGICRAFGIDFALFNKIGIDSPLQEVEVPDVNIVKKILSRSILLKAGYEYFFDATSYESLHERIITNGKELAKYDVNDQTWATRVRPFGKKKGVESVKQARIVAEWLPFHLAPIDLKEPMNKFVVLEEYASEKGSLPTRLHFVREIGEGQGWRKNRLNLPDRCYIGNTTMDPELALIQANITSIRATSLVLDPFCGTGGLLVPAADFGASVIGTEINYSIGFAQGKSSRHDKKLLTNESVEGNFVQYGTRDKFLSLILADASLHDLWAARPIFDAIVADPPYGVREKSRKIGPKERKEHWTLPKTAPEEHPKHYPEKQTYNLDSVFSDLLDLAAKSLVVGGRISFWFPVLLEKYSDNILPIHPCLRLMTNCEQRLTIRTSRRLLTYEKDREPFEDERASTRMLQFEEKSFREVALQVKK